MRFLALGLLALVFSSCLTPPDCLVTATNNLKIKFTKRVIKNLKPTFVDTTLTFLYVKVTGTDSLFYKGESKSSLVLPVNPTATETTFTLYQKDQTDTIAVTYTPRNIIISPECGSYVYYQSLFVVGTSYSRFVISSSQLSTSATSNIEIRF